MQYPPLRYVPVLHENTSSGQVAAPAVAGAKLQFCAVALTPPAQAMPCGQARHEMRAPLTLVKVPCAQATEALTPEPPRHVPPMGQARQKPLLK